MHSEMEAVTDQATCHPEKGGRASVSPVGPVRAVGAKSARESPDPGASIRFAPHLPQQMPCLTLRWGVTVTWYGGVGWRGVIVSPYMYELCIYGNVRNVLLAG